MVDKFSKSNRERKKDSHKNNKEIYNSKHIRIKFNNISHEKQQNNDRIIPKEKNKDN